MELPKKVLIAEGIEEYCVARGIRDQLLRMKNNLLSGYVGGSKFGKRNPFTAGLWYARINKKYRAIGLFENGVFKILYVDDHQ